MKYTNRRTELTPKWWSYIKKWYKDSDGAKLTSCDLDELCDIIYFVFDDLLIGKALIRGPKSPLGTYTNTEVAYYHGYIDAIKVMTDLCNEKEGE